MKKAQHASPLLQAIEDLAHAKFLASAKRARAKAQEILNSGSQQAHTL